MKIVENEKFSNRTKHIDTKYHFIREMNEQGELTFHYCSTEDYVADLLTKPLGPTKINYFRQKANIVD